MRSLLWIIIIFALAAAVAMFAGANQGYVLLVAPPWRAQASLNLVIVVLLLSFIAVYVLLRLISRTRHLPARVGNYRARRRHQKASESLKGAIGALFAGRFADSLRSAKLAYATGGESPEAALVAARAAHGMHDEKRYREWIGRSGTGEQGRTARVLTEAEVAIDNGRHDEARVLLDSLDSSGRESVAALSMALGVARAQGRWEDVSELVARLQRQHAITAVDANALLRRARVEGFRARAGDAEAIAAYWRELSKAELADPILVTQVIPLLAATRQGALARRNVERLLETQWSSELARHYVLCSGQGEEARDALSRAEKWLVAHPEDAGLLFSLGRQCMAAQIWGKAQSYLDESLAKEARADVHYALAELMERLERPAEAAAHFRKAAKHAAAGW